LMKWLRLWDNPKIIASMTMELKLLVLLLLQEPEPKKLYRDKDTGIIGGVLSGLGHYFGIDKVWLRILLLFLVWAWGIGFIAYFVLWIIIPEAKTTSEKLEMTGEPINISNIEKKVRQEFESVSEKIKNADYDKLGNNVKAGAERVGSSFGDFIIAVLKVFAKVLGAFIVVFSSGGLLFICIVSIIMMFSASLPATTIINHFSTPIGLETPLWIQGILFLLAAGIPLFFLLILGLKLLVSNMKSVSNVIKYSLLAVWIIAVGILISLGINELTQIAYDGKDVKRETINITPTDTLFVEFKNNDFYSKDSYRHTDFQMTQDENNKEVIYSNNVSIKVMKTDEPTPYIQIEKLAVGKSADEAKKRAEKIKYGYKIQGNHIILDNYLLSDFVSKFRAQHVELFLYLPKGTLLKTNESFENYDESDNNFFNLHFSSDDYVYKVDDSKVKCLNCPASENDFDDVEIDEDAVDSTGTIQLNKDGILIKTGNKTQSDKEVESVKINKDGVTIKTK